MRSSTVRVRGIGVHVEEAGRGQPDLVLLHGFGASTFSFHAVLDRLAARRRVVAFDRPGFGRSERPDPFHALTRFWYRPEGAVTATLGVMEACGLERPVLIGSSAGGTAAVAVALARPEAVRALVLVDAPVLGHTVPRGVGTLARLPGARRLLPWALRKSIGRALRTDSAKLFARAWHDPSKVTPATVEGYVAPLRRPGWDTALWAMAAEVDRTARPLDGRLRHLTLPVLVVTGDDDRVVPTEHSHRLAERLEDAELAVIACAGHLPHEEQPEAFLAAVEPFLDRVAPVGGGAGGPAPADAVSR